MGLTVVLSNISCTKQSSIPDYKNVASPRKKEEAKENLSIFKIRDFRNDSSYFFFFFFFVAFFFAISLPSALYF